MISKKTTAIIAVCAGAAVVAAGLFGIYRHYVTPGRIVALSLIDAKKNAERSLEYFDDDETEILEDYREEGGRFDADFTVSGAAPLDGMSFKVLSNSDSRCAVTDIGINDALTVTAYKDRERLYINMPLFKGGYEIPVADFAEKWNTSIFKDMAELPGSLSAAGIAAGFVSGKYSAEELIRSGGLRERLRDILEKNPVERNGSSAVTVDGRTRRARVYTLRIDRAAAESLLLDCFAGYILAASENDDRAAAERLRGALAEYADDYELSFLTDGMTLRAVRLAAAGGGSYTAAFEGKGNPFDTVVCYRDDDTRNALRRVHAAGSGKLSENIYFGQSASLTFEETPTMLSAKLLCGGEEFSLNAYGKRVTDDAVTFESAELSLDGICGLSGSFSISDEYDRDFAFNKEGQYVNLLEVSREEWEAVCDTLIKGIELLSR